MTSTPTRQASAIECLNTNRKIVPSCPNQLRGNDDDCVDHFARRRRRTICGRHQDGAGPTVGRDLRKPGTGCLTPWSEPGRHCAEQGAEEGQSTLVPEGEAAGAHPHRRRRGSRARRLISGTRRSRRLTYSTPALLRKSHCSAEIIAATSARSRCTTAT